MNNKQFASYAFVLFVLYTLASVGVGIIIR